MLSTDFYKTTALLFIILIILHFLPILYITIPIPITDNVLLPPEAKTAAIFCLPTATHGVVLLRDFASDVQRLPLECLKCMQCARTLDWDQWAERCRATHLARWTPVDCGWGRIMSSVRSRSCGPDRVLVLRVGVRPEALGWENRVEDTGPPETSWPHVISIGESSPRDLHLKAKTQFHSTTSKL